MCVGHLSVVSAYPDLDAGHGHSAPAHDMASKILPDTRPTSRPPATGADRDGSARCGLGGPRRRRRRAIRCCRLDSGDGAGPAPRGFSAVVHALVIAAPIAAGLYAVRVNPRGRFGWLLILAGVLWSPTMLAESPDSVLYSIGRVWVWFAELLLVYLVLAFPIRAVREPRRRLLFRAGVVAVGAYLLLALLGDFPTPNPWASCGTDCPPNAFMLPSSEPGFVDAVLLPITQALSVAVFAGVAVRLVGRLAGGSSLTRLELVPVLGRRCPANGCDRRLPPCARSES